MIYQYPITLENNMIFNVPPERELHFASCNGYDRNNIRVTNIVGYANGDFLKECPACGMVLPSEAFGLRTTENRDQSWCKDCR